MIMAGRGRRLEDTNEGSNKVGSPPISPDSKSVDLPTVINKITEIDPSNINLTQLLNLQIMFKQLFTSKETMRDALSDLHARALDDAEFGEKLVLSLEQVSHYEVDGALVRGEMLSFIQNDFKAKETVAQSNKKTFLNSVLLLGNVYHRFKVCGAPIVVLGIALLEYFDLLIKGEEEELKVLVKQICINGSKLSEVKNYEALIQNLRTALITTNLNSSSRCWILLAIDFMSNNLKPLNGALKDFYVKNLGDEYTKLESLIPVRIEPEMHSPVSPNSAKSQDGSSSGNKNFSFSPNKADGFRRDLSKKFSDMSMKPGGVSKDKSQSLHGKNHNRKDNWKSGGGSRGSSGHDDRFDKDENFYGAQKPRQPKPVNPKKKFIDFKITKKVDDDFKTDNNVELQQETAEDKLQN